ncbi:biotin synthase BioB [bacterium]|nr:biotin synthase BioB [bacterium]
MYRAIEDNLTDLISTADKIRRKFKGEKVKLCSIINAKSGMCDQDCAFCGQSSYHKTKTPKYPMLDTEAIVKSAMDAERNGAAEFSIVTSGKGINSREEIGKIKRSIKRIKKETSLECCASLGVLNKDFLKELKDAGLDRYHHNLETSQSFFPQICTTRPYRENVDTIIAAKEAGLITCCGGIFGMGESQKQRIELAMTLKELDPDSIPINFLNPVKNTKLENMSLLKPLEALKIIATFRIIFPTKDIIICGGREITLQSLQPMMLLAGANGMIIGDYLTTKGRNVQDDLDMIKDLGLHNE